MNLRRTLILALLPLLLCETNVTAQGYTCTDGVLRPNLPFRFDRTCMRPDVVEVKFRDDQPIRLRHGRLSVDQKPGYLNAVAAVLGDATIERVFTRPEAELDAERAACQEALAAVGQPPLEDLNNFYRVKSAGPEDTERLVNALNRLEVVATAYAVHRVSPHTDIAPPTPRLQGHQRYLDAAPGGLGFRGVASMTGTRLPTGSIAQVEGAWFLHHEDLARTSTASVLGASPGSAWDSWRDHGTACLGILVGGRNAYGIEGFASGTQRTLVASLENGDANAINLAASALYPGDVMSSSWGWDLVGGAHAPVDFFQAGFAAVRAAWARGIVYTFSAGNSASWLGDPIIYGGRYSTGALSSGGFIIGASDGPNPLRAGFSNFGDRIDANGWGAGVTTTGYGDAFFPGGDNRQTYTHTFGGTSAAAPMVAGVIASYLGAVITQNRLVLTPDQVRADLRATGTQLPGWQIGNRPDLAALLRVRNLPDGLLVTRPATLGSSATIELTGGQHDTWWLLGSLGTGLTYNYLNRPLLIDLASGFLLGNGSLGPTAGVNAQLAIPNDPALAGLQLELQNLVFASNGTVRLSNSAELWVDPRGTPDPHGFGQSSIWHNFFAVGNEYPAVGDFNGDGKDDIVTFVRGGTAAAWVALSNGSSFATSSQWHPFFAPGTETPATGDFNGDGKDDIVTFVQGQSPVVYVALSNGSSFQNPAIQWHTNFAPAGSWPAVGDFNGDGKDDIIAFWRGSNPRVEVALSNGFGFGPKTEWANWFAAYDEHPAVGDFDGDRFADIVTFQRSTGRVFAMRSTGVGFIDARQWHSYFCANQEVPRIGDFDGDGKSDAATFVRGNTPLVYTTLSNGWSFRPSEVWHDLFCAGSEVPDVGDFDGDGQDDIITFLRGGNPLVYVARSR